MKLHLRWGEKDPIFISNKSSNVQNSVEDECVYLKFVLTNTNKQRKKRLKFKAKV